MLLGCGPVGLAVSRLLGQERPVEKVIVADRVRERAAAAAELCGSKAVSMDLDVNDDSIAGLLGDVALVVNTVPLPARELLPLIRSVVEAGASYADSGHDAEAIQAVFESAYLEATSAERPFLSCPVWGRLRG